MPKAQLTHTPGDLLRLARLALHDGSDFPPDLRRTVSQSWARSRLAAVRPDKMDVPYQPDVGIGERLLQAARPVLERFAEQLDGTRVTVVLADPEARVVGRWAGDHSALDQMSTVSIEVGFLLSEDTVGTNGVGTVLEDLAPLVIHGGEHYAEPLEGLVCVGVPIRNPITRRLEGVLDLACPTDMASGLLLPTALSLGAQIESELASRMSRRETAVFTEFLARNRETAVPLIALGEQFMLTNAAAANFLEPSDQALFWDQAGEAFGDGHSVTQQFRLGSGVEVRALCKPIRIGEVSVGAMIEVASPIRPEVARLAAELTGMDHVRSQIATALHRPMSDEAGSPAVRVRVEGEVGTGKFSLVEELAIAADRNGPLTVLRCTSARAEGPDAWLSAFSQRLIDPTGTLVLRNLDQLPVGIADTVVGLLDDCKDPPATITTVTLAPSQPAVVGVERFRGVVIRVPALRERREDIPGLVSQLLRGREALGVRVSQRALTALVGYSWPGNLRQLAATLEDSASRTNSSTIELEHLPVEVTKGSRRRRPLSRIQAVERDAIEQALKESLGNKIQATEALGMSRSTLYRRLRYFGLDVDRAVL